MDQELAEKLILAQAAEATAIRLLLCEIVLASSEKETILRNFATAVETYSKESHGRADPEQVVQVRALADALLRVLRYPSSSARPLGT